MTLTRKLKIIIMILVLHPVTDVAITQINMHMHVRYSNMRFYHNRLEEMKTTPTEYLKLIIVPKRVSRGVGFKI